MSGVSLSRSPRPARAVSGPGRPLAARVGRSRAPEAHRLSGGDHGLCEATHCWPCRAGTKSFSCMKDDTKTNFDRFLPQAFLWLGPLLLFGRQRGQLDPVLWPLQRSGRSAYHFAHHRENVASPVLSSESSKSKAIRHSLRARALAEVIGGAMTLNQSPGAQSYRDWKREYQLSLSIYTGQKIARGPQRAEQQW